MKKKLLIVSIFVILILFTFFYTFSFTALCSLDEIWNYGFGKNILDGFIPYKDFNMVIPPLFPYLLALILKLFGAKLAVYYVLIAVMVAIITYLAYLKIGGYAIVIYLLLLVYPLNGYNTFTLLLLFLLLWFLNKESKYQDIIIPIIISLMILTKQSMVLLAIPSLIYSKKKLKTFFVYVLFFLLFLVYLFLHDNLIEFIDYGILGMFDFAEKNHTSVMVYLIVVIGICFMLGYQFIQSKGRKKEYFYVLMYQIITFPIVDLNHFILALVPFIYLLFLENRSKFVNLSILIVGIVIAVSLLGISYYITTFKVRNLIEHSSSDNYLKGKLIASTTGDYIQDMDRFIQKYGDYKLYILGNYSYLVKLALDIPITKYDLINNGNMGYLGASRYIQEIDRDCRGKKCLFIVNDRELVPQDYIQTNIKILSYVTTEYTKIYSSVVFGVYKN